MTKKYFGTDGVRGRANIDPVTPDIMLKLALAAGQYFQTGDHQHRVLIGKDTRLSGYMIETALTSGFTAMGMDVVLVGPLPTPAVAMLTKTMRADLGVMISASHNPFEDNGIKLFGPDGYKISDKAEDDIETLMDGTLAKRAQPNDIGKASRLNDAAGRYIEYVKHSFPTDLTLDGFKVVLDCANGAAYHVAPTVLRELGATVYAVGVSPNGHNINRDCGATAPQLISRQVQNHQADLGIALDGDADRLILCDENGAILDGDQIMALIATLYVETGQLKGQMVTTVMSNLGLERYINGLGVNLQRTPVGDRHVVAAMRQTGANLGGEQSGHLILGDHATTGDGLLAALQVLACLTRRKQPLSQLGTIFTPLPQQLKNIRLATNYNGDPLDSLAVKQAVARAEAKLSNNGRLLLRPSGTEPIIRIMVEAEDQPLVAEVIADIADALESVMV